MAAHAPVPDLSQLDTKQLNTLLLAAVETEEEINVALIHAITAELDRRSDAPPVDVDAQWNQFLTDYVPNLPAYGPDDLTPDDAPPPAKCRRPRLRTALIAAVIVVLALAVTVSANLSNAGFWKSFAQWSNETFGFSFGQPGSNPSINPEYLELKNSLKHAGVAVDLVPSYLPEGYVQTSFDEYSDFCVWIACYQSVDSEGQILLQIRKSDDPQGIQFEKDHTNVSVYVVNNIEHYIMPNYDTVTAVWTNGGYECSIIGTIRESTMREMIDSIYYYTEPE